MRILLSSFTFVITMVVGALLFAFTAIEFPTVMRELIAHAQTLPAYLSGLGLSDSYMVWVDILLSGDKLVLLGFILATRVVFAIVGGVLSPLWESSPRRYQQQDQASAFDGWGRR